MYGNVLQSSKGFAKCFQELHMTVLREHLKGKVCIYPPGPNKLSEYAVK